METILDHPDVAYLSVEGHEMNEKKDDLARADSQCDASTSRTASAVREGSAHTQGPLYLRRASTGDAIDIQTAPEPRLCYIVATAWGGGDMSAQMESNAYLFAAASDLLAALKAITDQSFGNPANPDETRRIEAMAEAAIAKAEGR